MRVLSMVRLGAGVCLLALLCGCDAVVQVAQDAADSAPPASVPALANPVGLYAWTGNTDYFANDEASSTFEFDVDHGFLNRLTILENGTAIPAFDGNDPNNGAHTTQVMAETASDPNAKTSRVHVKVFMPRGGFGEDRVVTFTLLEESINPAYQGTPQERATKAFTVVTPAPPQGITGYMRRCFKDGVPLPPDWAESGTAWQLRGNLGTGTNLLQPGINAFVWTHTDARFRGACIALPRGGGGQRGGLAGIICQSAVTGRACFWDSRLRDDADPLREMPAISWPGATLIIAALKDGSNITEANSGSCPICHRGDNVYLISPDDPTWSQVIKGTSNFTTRVEASADTRGGHPRYIPLTSVTGPGRGGDWENVAPAAPGCGSTCHENPALQFQNQPMPMPPNCAVGGTVESCYR